MARFSGRARMISSVNRLTGRDDCAEAVVVLERMRFAVQTSLGCLALVLVATIALRLPLFLVSPMVGLSILIPLLVGRQWIVARSGQMVLLARSSIWFPSALQIVAEAPAPLDPPRTGGILRERFELFDRPVYVPRPLMGRFRAVTGGRR